MRQQGGYDFAALRFLVGSRGVQRKGLNVMNRILVWVLRLLGLLLGVLVLVAVAGYFLGSARLGKKYPVPSESFSDTGGTADPERGARWTKALCSGCHGEDLGGKVFFDDPALGTFRGPNLTAGEGGASAEMSDEELATAIRHGIDHDGSAFVAMPSEAFFHLSDQDLGAIIAYLRAAPAVDKESEASRFSPLARVLVGLGMFGNVYAAEIMDHDAARAAAPPVAITAEYGGYLARVSGCASCHGPELSGGRPPDPASPPGPNLTPGGHLATWSEADFFAAMRTGVEPDGEQIENKYMPWEDFRHFSDDELSAMWLYLESLPALEDAVEEAE